MKEIVWLTFAVLVVFGQQGRAEQYSRTITSEWERPTERVDGSQLLSSEIARYELEYRIGDSAEIVSVDPAVTAHDRLVLTTGRHCAIIRVVDTGGLASEWSEPACIDVKSAPARIRIWFDEGG